MNVMKVDATAQGLQDIFAKKPQVDERMAFAVETGTMLVRTLDRMMSDDKIPEQTFTIGGSGEKAFEIVVRRKRK